MDKTVQSVKQNPFAVAFAQKNIEKLEPVLQDHLSRIIHLLDQSVGEEVDMRQKMDMFSAPGENTQIALTKIVWLLVTTPSAAARLQQELDDAYAARGLPLVSPPAYHMVKDLPDLRACIGEAIRLRPSLPGGLPRIVPAGGMHIAGEWFDEGVMLPVSTETVHRDSAVPEEYRPERRL